MAKRAAQKIKSIQGRSANTSTKLTTAKTKSFFRNVLAYPATPWVAGGLGLAVVARFAYKYYMNHPEILDSIKENLEIAEEKLKDFSGRIVGSNESDVESEDARH